jgi:hypothetical protein
MSNVGILRSAASPTTGPSCAHHADHYRRTTTRGNAPGIEALPAEAQARESDGSDLPLRPALRITSSVKPSRGTTRDSIPAAVPTEGHLRVRKPREKAWPPLPR